jgi:hypothetical protein
MNGLRATPTHRVNQPENNFHSKKSSPPRPTNSIFLPNLLATTQTVLFLPRKYPGARFLPNRRWRVIFLPCAPKLIWERTFYRTQEGSKEL